MRYKIFSLLFLAILTASLFWSDHLKKTTGTDPFQDPSGLARELISLADRVRKEEQPFPYLKVYKDSNLLGYVIQSQDLGVNIQGYGGTVAVALALDLKGAIMNIKILENKETPSYTARLREFIAQFSGKTPGHPIVLGRDVDAITGATVTSAALTRTIRQSLDIFSEQILNAGTRTQAPRPDPPPEKLREGNSCIVCLVSYALFALALTGLFLANNALRWLALLGGFLFFGVMTATMLSILQVANIALGNVPDIRVDPTGVLVLGLAFLSTLIVGRIYCGSLCPFALVQEVLFKCVPGKKRRGPLLSADIRQRTLHAKYIILILLIALAAVFQNSNIANVEPFVTLFKGQATKLAWALLALMLILATFHFRFWCVYLCPVGALTSLVSRISFFKIRPSEKCVRCDACAEVCPVKAIENDEHGLPRVDGAECLVCGKCLRVCPKKCLALKGGRG